jgi:nicotinate-nucleotide pyrophosphorylase (carboxylating)
MSSESKPNAPALPADLSRDIDRALAEDLGGGDLSAALVPADRAARATIVCREAAVLCGRAWAEQVFHRLSPETELHWTCDDGDPIAPGQVLCSLNGPARALLSGERTALNFLQTLSGTASRARRFVDAVRGTGTAILDTRKTLPGLRNAQKYAAACGGCRNHRHGLYDGVLIKENHIAACGSITAAVQAARLRSPLLTRIEVEVESLGQIPEAVAAGADLLLLDNLSPADLSKAVARCRGKVLTEASGNVTLETIRAAAETGVDFISVGAITKHLCAVDLSMRFET